MANFLCENRRYFKRSRYYENRRSQPVKSWPAAYRNLRTFTLTLLSNVSKLNASYYYLELNIGQYTSRTIRKF